MIILACLLTVAGTAGPNVLAVTGDLLRETPAGYIADFSNAVNEEYGYAGDYSKVYIRKDLCIKEVRK